jgi:hypothetical protein
VHWNEQPASQILVRADQLLRKMWIAATPGLYAPALISVASNGPYASPIERNPSKSPVSPL